MRQVVYLSLSKSVVGLMAEDRGLEFVLQPALVQRWSLEILKSLLTVFFCLRSSTSLIYWYVLLFLDRRKSKARRSKSRYKMLEADEQDTLELQPPRAGKNTQPSQPALLPHTWLVFSCII